MDDCLSHLSVVLVQRDDEAAQVYQHVLRRAGARVERAQGREDVLLCLARASASTVVIALAEDPDETCAVLALVRTHQLNSGLFVVALADCADGSTLEQILEANLPVVVLSHTISREQLVDQLATLTKASLVCTQLETRARRLEDQLRARAQQLADVRQQVETLEHELRTPLGVVLGIASNLRDGVDGKLPARVVREMDRIVGAAMNVTQVLDQTLETTHELLSEPVDVDRAPSFPVRQPQRVQVDLGSLVEEVLGLFEIEARRRDLTLAMSSKASLEVWGEPTKLRQLVINLLANATRFTPPGGTITCSVELGRVSAGEAGSDRGSGTDQRRSAHLVVSDTGPGVPAPDRKRIFERGVRLEQETAVAGRGLGLAICQEIIALHGGQLWVEDAAPAGGARFVASLPLDRRARQSRGILLVSDHDQVRQLLGTLSEVEEPGEVSVVACHQAENFARAAVACEAVVVVPQGQGELLQAVVKRLRQDITWRRRETAKE